MERNKGMKSIPFNINKLSKKDKATTKRRAYRRKNGYNACSDGTGASREMAQATRLNIYRRMREEKENPYTKHPLSFEEFDKIPDIGDLIEDNKKNG